MLDFRAPDVVYSALQYTASKALRVGIGEDPSNPQQQQVPEIQYFKVYLNKRSVDNSPVDHDEPFRPVFPL